MNHVLSTGRFRLSTGVAILVLLGSFGFSQAVRPDLDPALAATTCPEQVGHWPYGPSHAVAVDGDTAFFGVGSVLRVADVSDPENPVVLSEIPLGNLIVDMEITGDLLVAAISESGVAVVDVSDPANPTLLGSLFLGEIANAVTVLDGYALVGGYSLWIVDLSNPSDLVVAGTLDAGVYRVRDLAVTGNVAVLADSSAGLLVVDVSNPSSPALLATHSDDLSRPMSVDISGEFAFLMEEDDDIVVFDISNPNSPSIAARVDPGSNNNHTLHVSGNSLYVGRTNSSQLTIYDISDPTTPVELWDDSHGFGQYIDFATAGTNLYSAQYHNGLGIYDISTPSAPQAIGHSRAENRTRSVAMWDTYAVAGVGSSLVIFDLSDPGHLVELSRHIGANASDLAIRDDLAYAVRPSTLYIIDLTDPSAPATIGEADLGGGEIALTGNLAMIGGSADGIRVVDIGDPTAPEELATIDADYAVTVIAASGPAVYVPENDVGLHIFDVSTPAAPVEIGVIEVPDISNDILAAADGLLIVADRGNGIRIYDISNPLQPVEVSFYTELTRWRSFSLDGDLLVVVGNYSDLGLHVLDLSDPSAPLHLGTAPLLVDQPNDGDALNGLALVVEEDNGFEIFDLEICALGPATADFSWTPTLPWIGSTVSFNDASTGWVTNWAWAFGDGSTATTSDPSHVYTSAETYSVQLMVTGPNGSDSVTKSVTITEDPPETPPIEEAGALQWVIPASAHSPGAQGTSWVSDVVIHNTGAQAAVANVYFMKGGQDNSGAIGHHVEIPGGTSVALDDIVFDLFGLNNASGAVLIGSETELLIASRTYNDASSGTYGQFIPGLPVSEAAGAGDVVRLIQLTRNETFRTNIGWANPGPSPVNLTIDFVDARGGRLGTHQPVIPPFGYGQANDILPANVNDAMAVVSTGTPGSAFFVYASVVDNSTGDPVLILEGKSGTDLYIPAAAHVQGLAGTDWKTDLEIADSGDWPAVCTIDLLKTGFDNSTPRTTEVTIQGNNNFRLRDVLAARFDHDGSAALRIRTNGSEITTTSSTFNTTAEGTYGQFISGTTSDAAITQARPGVMIQLSQSGSGTSGFRTNLGLLNITGSEIEVLIELFDRQGASLGTTPVLLKPFEHRQINRVFREVTESAVTNGFARVSTQSPRGAFFAYSSVVDNRSGDPVFMPAWRTQE